MYTARAFSEIEFDAHVKKRMPEMDVEETFVEYLTAVGSNTGGYSTLSSKIFLTLLDKVKEPEDIKKMKNIVADFLGHRNKIGNKNMDTFLKHGFKIDPVGMIDFIKYHRQLLYYPHPDILDMYTEFFANHEDYQNYGKRYALACRKEHYLKKTDKFYNSMIPCTHKNGDMLTTQNLYIDILDYEETKLNTHSLNCVLDAVNPKNVPLLSHIKGYIVKNNIEKDFSSHMLTAANWSNSGKLYF